MSYWGAQSPTTWGVTGNTLLNASLDTVALLLYGASSPSFTHSLSPPISPPALSWTLPPPGPHTHPHVTEGEGGAVQGAALWYKFGGDMSPWEYGLCVWLHRGRCGCGCAVLCGRCLLLWCHETGEHPVQSIVCKPDVLGNELVSANTSSSCSCRPSPHLFGPFSPLTSWLTPPALHFHLSFGLFVPAHCLTPPPLPLNFKYPDIYVVVGKTSLIFINEDT